MSITAMKQALEVLEWNLPFIEDYGDKEQLSRQHKAIESIYDALRQAIAEKALNKKAENARGLGLTYEQEPVAWANPSDLQNFDMKVRTHGDPLHSVPLYTHPPKREPLTDEQIIRVAGKEVATKIVAGHSITPEDWLSFARAIEAAHGIKEKNT